MQKLFCVVAVCLWCYTNAQQWPVAYDVNESLPVLDISLGPPVHQMPESAVMGNVDGGVDTLQGALVAAQSCFDDPCCALRWMLAEVWPKQTLH